jgi:hypothetical protein
MMTAGEPGYSNFMRKRLLFSVVIIFCGGFLSNLFAQKTCTSNPTTISANINFGAIAWTAGGGATVAECNNMADGLITFTGNVIVNLANNKTITISNDVSINGDFPISGGPGSLLSVTGNSSLHVTGDLGDATNNGVQYNVAAAGDAIVVDGTLYGKNNNAFTGSGSISGGTLDVKNGSTCGTPCPVAGGFANCASGDGFCATYGVLPIELLFFNGSKGLNKISLSWATASELNFDYFDVEKSVDGSNFYGISKVVGHGTTNTRQEYSFNDEKPLNGKNYYRLKSVDFDGYTEYFNVIMVDFDGKNNFSIYPNPSDGVSFTAETNFTPKSRAFVAIYSMIGSEIARYEVSGEVSTLTLPMKLESGVYFAKYISADFTSTTQVLVK